MGFGVPGAGHPAVLKLSHIQIQALPLSTRTGFGDGTDFSFSSPVLRIIHPALQRVHMK